MSRSFHIWAACTQGCHPFLGSKSPNAKDRWSTRDMTEPRVQELEQGHPSADDFTAWHSKQAQLFQLTPRLCRPLVPDPRPPTLAAETLAYSPPYSGLSVCRRSGKDPESVR